MAYGTTHKTWFQKLCEDVAYELHWCCIVSLTLMALWWLAVLAYKWFNHAAVLYAYHPEISAETVPPVYMAVLLLLSICFNTISFRFSKPPHHSPLTLRQFGPATLAFALSVLGGWIYAGPSKDASYLPICALILVSSWGTYAAYAGICETAMFNTLHVRRRTAMLGRNRPRSHVWHARRSPSPRSMGTRR